MNYFISKEDLIYIACFVDCEGSVQINKIGILDNYHISVNFDNTNKQTLNWIKIIIGVGEVRMVREETIKHKRKHRLILRTNEIKEVLKSLVPYLKIKKYQSLIMLEWLSSIKDKRKVKGKFFHGRTIDIEESVLREILFDAISLLNKKGPWNNEELIEIQKIKDYYDSIYIELLAA